MSTQYEIVLQKMRARIISKHWQPGERLMELRIAEELGVSRTPVRLALGMLAQEGLLQYFPQRGFVVRSFTPRQIIDAIIVRERLEALATELLARMKPSPEVATALRTNLQRTEKLLHSQFGDQEVTEWSNLNAEFHETIVTACGNLTVAAFARELDSVPLAAARRFMRAETTDDRRKVVEQALFMHRLIWDAIETGEAGRAQMLMAEHVQQGREAVAARLAELSSKTPSNVEWAADRWSMEYDRQHLIPF